MMVVKKYSKNILALASLTLATVSFAQTEGAKREQQISNLKELTKLSSDSKESFKAKQLLNDLQKESNQAPPVATTPKKTAHEIEFEAQKHATETLSSDEYDKWKANRISKEIQQSEK